MVAGLISMTAISCSEKTTTETDADTTAPEKTEETAEAAPETGDAEVAAASAYYVMFKGDGG